MQIEGKNPVLETLRAGNKVEKIVLNSNISVDDKIKEILGFVKSQKIKLVYKNRRTIDKLAETRVNQGVIAYRDLKEEDILGFEGLINKLLDAQNQPFFIFIRDAFNEYNVGSIIRSAEASGANGVILPPKIILSSQMIRSSMGGSEHLSVMNHNLFDAIKICKKYDIKVVAIEVTGEKYYFEEDLSGPVMLIIGGEDRSISSSITEKCDTTVKIPLKGKINSLNMSIAASIVMYEKVRQGNQQK